MHDLNRGVKGYGDNNLLDMDAYVVETFGKHFSSLKNQKIALYGIGPSTKLLIQHFPDFNIVGLMDETRTEDIYDKPILTASDLIVQNIKIIVIVARMRNVKLIYRRIQNMTTEQSIKVYDINGKLLESEVDNQLKDFTEYDSISYDLLCKKIEKADAISFDIFDTLIMRNVLYPRDIFDLLEQSQYRGFAKERKEVGAKLHQDYGAPTIYDIYHELPNAQMQQEIELEKQYIIKREKVCEALEYAKRCGKEVYLVSDMYLTADMIKQLLDLVGIEIEINRILVSSDYGVSKLDGLFEILLSRVGEVHTLHIGDNLDADIYAAKRYGIHDTFYLKSALNMLEDSYAAEILQFDGTLENRLIIGELIATQLNNPFLFHSTKGKFQVDTFYELNYSFIAPMVYRFFMWMIERVREYELDCILLPSRDGYIIEKIYQFLKEQGVSMPPMIYFYTSRKVATLASIKGDEDILHVADQGFAGEWSELIKIRFNLEDTSISSCGNTTKEDYILQHRDKIMDVAKQERENYMKYIKSLDISQYSKLGFVELVSSGTSLKALTNVMEQDLIGLFLACSTHNIDYKSSTQILAMYGQNNPYGDTCNLMKYYLFLECIFASHEPTLIGIDNHGKCILGNEERSNNHFVQQRESQQGICDYVRNKKSTEYLCDVELCDYILGMINSKYMDIHVHNEFTKDFDKFAGQRISIDNVFA